MTIDQNLLCEITCKNSNPYKHFVSKEFEKVNNGYNKQKYTYKETTKLDNYYGTNRFRFKFNNYCNYLAYSNLRCDFLHEIESVALEIGRNIIDEINYKMFDAIRHIFDVKDKSIVPIPLLLYIKFLIFPIYYETCIIIHLKKNSKCELKDIILNADIFELDPANYFVNSDNIFECMIPQIQNSDTYDIKHKINKYELNFNHMSQYLIIKYEQHDINPIINIKLILNGMMYEPKFIKYRSYYIINFVPNIKFKSNKLNEIFNNSINFSRLGEIIIEIELESFIDNNDDEDDENKKNVFDFSVININILRHFRGMMVTAYIN